MRVTIDNKVFVVVLVLHISSCNYLPCVLILHKRSGPRSVSDLCTEWLYKYLKLKKVNKFICLI